MHVLCREWVPRDLCGAIILLLKEARRFLDPNNTLNSDGRRLLETIVRRLIDERPEYRGIIHRVRREPSLENVLRLANILLDNDPSEILSIGLGYATPYYTSYDWDPLRSIKPRGNELQKEGSS